jgi:acetolactate decarboxylase
MLRRTLLILLLTSLLVAGCGQRPANQLCQTSTITALLEGVYDGDMALSDLSRHGDFGLGTFNDIDGEMILLGGTFYQVKSDGKAYRPEPGTRTPLAVATFFKPASTVRVDSPLSYEGLRAKLDTLRTEGNTPYAFRITGEFERVHTRSVPRQSPPYRRLVEVTREQPTFEFKDVQGSLVVFWVPQYLQQLNVPGYHLHFLTADGSAGGHVLEVRPRRVRVEAAPLRELFMRVPQTRSFREAVLDEDRRAELHKVEQATTRETK